MEAETDLNLTNYDASQLSHNYIISLPPSYQATEQNVFANKFWQGRPSPPRKGLAALLIQSAGFLTDFAITQVTGDNILKHIKDVLTGDNDETKKEKVLQHFENNWNTINKDLKYWKGEKITRADAHHAKSPNTLQSNTKSLNVHYLPVHLAVIYNVKEILEEFFKHMKEDSGFCREVLFLKLETNLTVDDLKIYTKIPDEACGLSTMFLCVKYNSEALVSMLEIAKQHDMLDDVLNDKELRGMNLIHFSTLNISLECVQILLASSDEERKSRRNLLYSCRTTSGESALHTARTCEMVDFLLKSKEKDPCQEEMTKMIYSRDSNGNNVLSHYIGRDLDLTQHFLDHHISTNGHNSNSEKFLLCLDVSPIIAQQDGNRNVDETSVIGALEPLTKCKRNVLLHPLINTFVMMKYNSYASFFLSILAFKVAYAVSLTGLAVSSMSRMSPDCFVEEENKTVTSTTEVGSGDQEIVDFAGQSPLQTGSASIWVWSIISGILTMIMLLKEIVEMINLKAAWVTLENLVQVFLMVSVFTFGVIHSSGYCWIRYLAAWIVFAGWMDITMSLRYLMFGKWSSLGLYIIMLKEVAKKVFMFFGIYFTSLLGFTFVFMILVKGKDSEGNDSPFEAEGQAFVKIVAMMIGEVEYGDTFAGRNLAINMVFLMFVFMIPIIINNLLIGLTVSNVSELIMNANAKSLESKIRIIAQFERSFVITKLLYKFSSISKKTTQEVCIQPSQRKKSIISECDLTIVHNVIRDNDDQRTMGEKLQFLFVDTYVPISVYENAISRIGN